MSELPYVTSFPRDKIPNTLANIVGVIAEHEKFVTFLHKASGISKYLRVILYMYISLDIKKVKRIRIKATCLKARPWKDQKGERIGSNISTNYKSLQVPGCSISKAITANRSPLVKLEEANGNCHPENTIFRQSGFLADGRQSSTT